jgi:hypothetical protein
MDLNQYIFLGVGVALSVLSFFLKKEAQRSQKNDARIAELEKMVTKNEALDNERWITANKLLEDRREDIKNIYAKLK